MVGRPAAAAGGGGGLILGDRQGQDACWDQSTWREGEKIVSRSDINNNTSNNQEAQLILSK
jgi:hypothetical protein